MVENEVVGLFFFLSFSLSSFYPLLLYWLDCFSAVFVQFYSTAYGVRVWSIRACSIRASFPFSMAGLCGWGCGF